MSNLARDPGATATTLERWLATLEGVTDVEVGEVAIPGTTGWSNETIFFTASWLQDGRPTGHRELVARIAPTSYTVFPDDTFRIQHEVMRTLAERTHVPMAKIHWFEAATDWFGAEFWIMERIRGDVPSDAPPYASSGWLHDATPEQQAQAWWSGIDAMAEIHRLDLDALALPGTAVPAGPDPLAAQLDHYERFLHWAEDGRPHALSRRALAWLRSHQPAAPEQGPALTWGDARLSNLIYDDFRVAAVFDWEMTSIADPLLDLGWWLFADETLTHGSGCTRLPGFASKAETAAHWSEATGRDATALDYYLVLAGFRFTVIMLRMGKLLAQAGFVDAEFADDNLISQGLAALLA